MQTPTQTEMGGMRHTHQSPKGVPSTFTPILLALPGPSSSPLPSPAHTAHPASSKHCPMSCGPGTFVGEERVADNPGVLGPAAGAGSQPDGALGPGWHAPLCVVQLKSCLGRARAGPRAEGPSVQASEALPLLLPLSRYPPQGWWSTGHTVGSEPENGEQSPSSQTKTKGACLCVIGGS